MVLFNACMSYYLNLDCLLRMILAMFDELGRVERVLNIWSTLTELVLPTPGPNLICDDVC